MGNRAVICFDKYDDDAIGIYLHWNGSPETIEGFLSKTRDLMADRMPDPEYARARLIQVIGNEIGGNASLGLGYCKDMDTDNGDNGTYVVNCGTLTIKERLFN